MHIRGQDPKELDDGEKGLQYDEALPRVLLSLAHPLHLLGICIHECTGTVMNKIRFFKKKEWSGWRYQLYFVVTPSVYHVIA